MLEALKEEYTVKLLYSLFHHLEQADSTKERVEAKCEFLQQTMD